MTAKEVAQVMGTQFIAVERTTGEVSFSGDASQFRGWLEDREVVEIKAAVSPTSVTIIYVR